MTEARSSRFWGVYVTFIGLTFVSVAVIGLVGYFPTVRLAGGDSVRSMVIGCGVSWLAGCLGAVAFARAVRDPAKAGQSILTATAVRFVAVLMLVVPLVFSGLVDRRVFVVWVALSYVLLLLVETPLAVRLLRRLPGKQS